MGVFSEWNNGPGGGWGYSLSGTMGLRGGGSLGGTMGPEVEGGGYSLSGTVGLEVGGGGSILVR